MSYDAFRQFADSWGLVYMLAIFVVVVAFVFFRPGSKKEADDAAEIPFREDDRPDKDGSDK